VSRLTRLEEVADAECDTRDGSTFSAGLRAGKGDAARCLLMAVVGNVQRVVDSHQLLASSQPFSPDCVF